MDQQLTNNKKESSNKLWPVFFRLDRLRILIVGAGEVGHEKLSFMLKSSPNAHLTVVAPWISDEVGEMIMEGKHDITVHQRPFDADDMEGHSIVIAATNNHCLNLMIYAAAKEADKIVNVADTPRLCDFYMGSIVTRGDLKVAISTNGKSPTFAKRFRQLLEDILPEDTNDLISNLKVIRDRLKGGFAMKVKKLNEITSSLIEN